MIRVIGRIGNGGFGNVDHVMDEQNNSFARKTFSINQPLPAELRDNVQKRFIREANVQFGFRHKNIVPVSLRELAANPPYFLMPLASSSLDKDIKNNRNLNGKFITAIMDILSGLEELHSMGIYHRDLKPQNVLRFEDSSGSFYAISDFGLMSIKDTQLSALTQTGMRMGSDYYTAPEIVADLRRASPASDIYSVGCILHDFVGTGDRIPCNEINDDASAYADIIRACTRRDPARRFSNVAALRDAILSIDPKTVTVFNAEITDFITYLSDDKPINEEIWRSIISYVEDNFGTDEVKTLLHKIDLNKIKEIVLLNNSLAARLGEKYAAWVANDSFYFEQCDGICNRLCEFLNVADLTCQSETIIALLLMGTSHNRWYVERRFVAVAGPTLPPPLAKRVALEMSILEGKMCRAVAHLHSSIGVSYEILHPEIVAMIQRVCR
ncbi:hypothetical protein ARC310_07840 [Pantoea ananatis]|uniref:serine/threonine-protein kinase n=1 Tax=Pantoea ananas TaxID=553 RepID=UPI000DA69BCE|nr:serine/threonine-protein kinase [Pantoea ananatis]PZD64807.1 hypothetical protein ARC310_07840 [Pantoea ananatis]PZD66510.1 hypothetical protein ARC311_08550 [Pantoea ananatis]